MNRVFKGIYRTIIIAMAIAAIGIIGIFYWLVSAPRSLPYISSYLEETMQEINPNYHVKIENSVVRWSGWQAPLTISVNDLKVTDAEGSTVASFPEMRFRLKVFGLFLGKLRFNDIAIVNPRFNLNALQESESDQEEKLDIESVKRIAADLVRLKSIPFKNLDIINAEFLVNYRDTQFTWNVSRANARFLKGIGFFEFKIDIDGDFSGTPVLISSSTIFTKKGYVETVINYRGIDTSLLKYVFPKSRWASIISTNLDGEARLIVDRAANLKLFNLSFNSNDASTEINLPEYFESTIPISDITGSISVNDNFSVVTLDELSASFSGPRLKVKNLSVQNLGTENEGLNGTVVIESLKIDDLHRFWPKNAAVDAREWVLSSITKGIIKDVAIKLDLKPGDMNLPKLPKEAVLAEINVENAVMTYDPELPSLENINGKLLVNSEEIDIAADSATVKKSALQNGKALITGLNEVDQFIEISGDVVGDAKDLQDFLNLQKSHNSYTVKLTGGSAKTNFIVDFPLRKDLRMEHVNVKVKSFLSDINLPKIQEDVDITNGNFELNYDSTALNVVGEGLVNEVRSTIRYEEKYQTGEIDSFLSLSAGMQGEQLKNFGVTGFDFVKGSINTFFSLTNKNGAEGMSIKVDADNADIDLVKLGWFKPVGKPAKFELSTTANNQAEFKVNAETLAVAGTINFQKDFKDVKEIKIKNLAFGKNDLQAHYKKLSDQKYELHLSGASIDFEPVIDHFQDFSNDKEKQAFLWDLDIKTAYLKNSNVFYGLKGKVECGLVSCLNADVYAKVNKNDSFSFKIVPEKNHKKLSIDSNNAGAIIGGIGITPNIAGGKLELKSTIVEKDGKSLNTGILTVRDFSLGKAPILAKILTLASFTGIVDLLNGKGIIFKKMTASFALTDEELLIKNGRSYGESLGITGEGRVDLKNKDSNLDIEGTVIPAYTLNSFISKVPLIGDTLTGGEGQGILASTYRLKGTYAEPEITVNPLSMLAPGFLRNFMDIFEGGKPAADKETTTDDFQSN